MRIHGRDEWHPRGGRGSQDGAKREAFVHHSVTKAPANTKEAQAGHMRYLESIHLGKGWAGIAYSHVVFPDGSVWEGRGFDHLPAAQAGHNSRTLAVCVVGNYQEDSPTAAVLRAVARVIREAQRRGHPIKRIGGHRDVTPTGCPGDHLYARLDDIRRYVRERGGESRKHAVWQRSLRINRARLRRILDGRRHLRAEGKEDTARYRWTTRAMRATRKRINKLLRLLSR